MITLPGKALFNFPCFDVDCGHPSCDEARVRAKALCPVCNRPIGYYSCHRQISGGRFAHNVCLDAIVGSFPQFYAVMMKNLEREEKAVKSV